MTERFAVYYAPDLDDPLWRAGCGWLGRDPTGAATPMSPAIEGLAELTADPRGYGFHATLKPPMRLRDGAAARDLLDDLALLAATLPRFALPPLAVSDHHGFLCLRETQASVALQALCDAVVAGPDHLRAPPGEAELARRRAAGLSPVREANLRRWGYPDVFATWYFHMTLTRRIEAGDMRRLRPAAESWFADSLARDRQVTSLCVFHQPSAGAAFSLMARVPLAT